MEPAASASVASARPMEPHCPLAPQSSDDASSSYSPCLRADLRPVACDASGEDGVLLDLDSQWAAAAEAERILGEAAAVHAAASLKISGEEEQQEEDGLRDNQQRQEDELTALDAIYGPDLVVLENKGGLRYFQIYIRYEVPDGIEVCTKLSSANVCAKDDGCSDGTGHNDGSEVFNYKCNFEYLPPLVDPSLDPFQVLQSFKDQLNVPFFMEIIISMCWTIWRLRNDWIFRQAVPQLQNAKSFFRDELLLLALRMKASNLPRFNQWINNLL